MPRIRSAWVVSASLALFACGGGNNGGEADAGSELACDDGAAAVTADQLFAAVVEPKCKSCHNSGLGQGSNGGLHLGSVDELKAAVGKASSYGTVKVVEADHPENSSLYLKVLGGSPKYKGPEGQLVGGQMPQGGNALSAEEKNQVRDWICSGAN